MVKRNLVKQPEAASYLGLSEATLERDRWRDGEIPYIKVGPRAIRYDLIQLNEYLERKAVRKKVVDHTKEELQMTDKELAEKTAKYLGWIKDGNVWNKWESSTYSPVKWLEPLEGKGGIEAVVFTWSICELIIDNMEKLGWEISWTNNGIIFCLPALEKETRFYSCKGYGKYKAIAMAFCEAVEMKDD